MLGMAPRYRAEARPAQRGAPVGAQSMSGGRGCEGRDASARARRRAASRASPRRGRTARSRRRARPRCAASPRRRPTAPSSPPPAARSFSARTPISRTGSGTIDRARTARSAASPIRWPTAVGSGSVCDREIVVKSAKRTLIAMVDASHPCCAAARRPGRRAGATRSAGRPDRRCRRGTSLRGRRSSRRAACRRCRGSTPRARCQMRSPIAAPSARSRTARGVSSTSATVWMPRASSDSAALGPMPHSARTERGRRNASVSASATMSRPSGLLIVEAIFATCFVAATPMLQVSPVSSSTRCRSARAI